jgi:hypothetical protein
MTVLRYLGSLAAGAGLYCLAYHPWLPYSVRERSMQATDFLLVLLGGFAAGAVAAWGSRRARLPVAGAFLAGMWAANAVVISADWKIDPTDHNLFPFEFVILGIVATPALAGAWLGGWMGSANPSKAEGA